MTYALGDVIAQIGGDGGGGVTPLRYVYELGGQSIPTDSVITHVVPDVPEGATLVATLEWDGPETGELAVVMEHGPGIAAGVAINAEGGFPPVNVVTTASGAERGLLIFMAVDEGYTATSLTVIIIPTINEAT